MYSRRLRQRQRARRQAFEKRVEVGSGELPLERPGEDLVVGSEGEDPGGELLERGRVGRREDLALEDAEVDLDLIEPRRVDRQVDEAQGGGLAPQPPHPSLATGG